MRKGSERNVEKRLVAISAGLLLCTLLVLFQVAVKVRAEEKEEDFYKFVDIFTEVYSEIKGKYVEEVDSRELFEGALRGMFMTLDSHSQFMSPDAFDQLEKDTEGEFSGIGIHIALKDGILTVIAPIPGTPAAKEGLRSWDRIIEIEGKSTEGITLIEAVKKLTGTPGTEVSITVYRKGETEPLYFTITRATIKINSIYYKMITKKIGYIRVTKFSEETARDMKNALFSLKKQGANALIIDLRYNSGGLLDVVEKMSDFFVPEGEIIVSTKGRIPSQNRVRKAMEDPIWEKPIIVLVNQGSASASEILTGAIKDHNLGVVIAPKGQTTFGKGSVQTIEELDNTLAWDENGNPKKSAIRLTTARYYTPDGTMIDKIGITPDIEIDLPEGNELELQRRGLMGDPDMNEPAIFLPETEDDDKPTTDTDDKFYIAGQEKETEEKEDFIDVQLQEAVKIMRAYLIMSGINGRNGGVDIDKVFSDKLD